MADVKISALPGATTPVAGSEVLPIVQGGVTKKVSIDNLTAGKAVSGLSFTATNLKTSPATANLDISGTTIAAGGSDANIDVNINAKGSGIAYLNQRWGVNQSGALVASANNTYDIGNGASDPRDINLARNLIAGGTASAAGYQLSSSGIITESGTTRTLSATDNGKVIYCTSGSAITINCAAGLGAGFSCTIIQGGAGQITVAANGQTLVSYSSLVKTMGQYAVASIICPVANTFLLAGNLGV